MTLTRHPFLSRALALGILLLVVVMVGFGVILPLFGLLQGEGEEVEQQQHLLAGYQRQAARLPSLQQRLAALKQEAAGLTGIWPGATAALAVAGLQGEVRRLVDAAGGQIRGAQEIPAKPDGGFERIGLRLDLTVPMTGLPGLLKALDAHAPYIFLDTIELHAPDALPGAASSGGAPILTVRCELSGYRSGGPA